MHGNSEVAVVGAAPVVTTIAIARAASHVAIRRYLCTYTAAAAIV